MMEELIESWHERPAQTLFALLLLWVTAVIVVIAGELIIIYVSAVTALLLFIGGVLLVLSTKPREYKNAAWMSGIAFYLLLNSMEGIKTLGISFLNATSILTWTAIAFILLAIFEKCITKKYMYAFLAFIYIATRALSH